MLGGVGGGVTLPEASAGGAVNPAKNTRASAAMRAPISFESPKAPFGCNVLQFMFVMFFFSFDLRLIWPRLTRSPGRLNACPTSARSFRLSLVMARNDRKKRQPASRNAPGGTGTPVGRQASGNHGPGDEKSNVVEFQGFGATGPVRTRRNPINMKRNGLVTHYSISRS